MKDTTIRGEIQQAVIADNRHIEAVVGLDLGDKTVGWSGWNSTGASRSAARFAPAARR